MKIIGRPLKEIVDDLENLRDECQQWYQDNVELRMLACTSRTELKALIGGLSLACCDDDGRIRDIPMEIRFPPSVQLSDFPEEF